MKLTGERKIEDVVKFRQSLSKETDRGCALYASSYIDEALRVLFASFLVKNGKIDEDLFIGKDSPLSSFSSRVKLSYYLGLISRDERSDLNTIRKIRNEFAHSPNDIDFTDSKISSLCNNLKSTCHDKSHRPRGHFTAACMAMLAAIHTKSAMVEHLNEKPNKPISESSRERIKNLSQDVIKTKRAQLEKLLEEVESGKYTTDESTKKFIEILDVKQTAKALMDSTDKIIEKPK